MGNVRAKFFRDGQSDRVEISIVGDPNTLVTKVQPKHLAQFPVEWAHYRSGEKEIDYGGTELTEVPGITASVATALKLQGIHNAEMLASISDAAAHGMGMGGLTMRNTAQLLLRAAPAPAAADKPAPARRGRPPKVVDLREDDRPVEPLTTEQLQSADLDLQPVEDD
jgi:hypothetical protein